MKKIICLGSACKDIFFPTSEGKIMDTPEDLLAKKKIAFELGAKYKIEERFETLGGCAVNVACALSLLGIESACYSKLGDDNVGQWIRSRLADFGINQELLSQESGFSSDLSAIIVDHKSGDRIIFSNQKVNSTLEIVPEELAEAEWIFIGDLQGDWETHLENIFELAKEKGIRVAFNPRQSNIHDNAQKIVQSLPFSEIVFLNKDEAIEVVSVLGKFSSEELEEEKFLILKLKELGAQIVVITDGDRGAWATEKDQVFFVPSIKVESIDSTGAGDAFSGAFWAAHLKGKSLAECLKWGIINGGNVVQFYGGQKGLLSLEEIEEKAKKLEVKEI